MLSFLKNNIKAISLFAILMVVSVYSFQKNYFEFARQDYFARFQTDSEGLVAASIVADRFGLDKKGAHLGYVSKNGEFIYDSPDVYALLGNGEDFFLTDGNWDRGVARHSAGFFVPNKNEYSAAYKAGRSVKFADGDVREIVRIESGASYLNVYVTGAPLDAGKVGYPSKFIVMDRDGGNEAAPGSNQNLAFSPYKSQYGIQGIFFGKIHELFKIGKLSHLQLINTILLSAIFVSLFFLYRKIYDGKFAAIFLLTLIGSPWIIFFARNLYWTPFLWFLPALFAALIYLKKGVAIRSLLLSGIVAAVFVKSLAGYEYLSAITLLACSVFVVAPFFRTADRDFAGNARMFILVFVACVIGFLLALLVHAGMRGDSIVSGLKNIIEEDVKRRTYGDASAFPEIYRKSLESSPLSVIRTYVADWGSIPVTLWIPGYLFKALIGFSIVGVCYKFLTGHATAKRDAILLVFFFMASASWLVLAKGHSYIHTHLNFVLWYFGFAQVLLYVAFNFVMILSIRLFQWIGTRDVKDF